MIINFQTWVYKSIRVFSMVLFYDYKFSKMDISKILKQFSHVVLLYDYKFLEMGRQGNESFFFLET